MLEAGRNFWRIEQASRAALIVDAADYFRLARQAMVNARSQILMIGWDFDPRIDLVAEADDGAPTQLGAFISWLPKQRPGLKVHILRWDIGTLYLLGRGSTIFRVARWAASRAIHFKLDGAHAAGASHHHKIVVIDDQLAFCGGIDMTVGRWDTRQHSDGDDGRRTPTLHRPYQPWHDATMAVDGAAAKALGELARERWQAAGGKAIAAPSIEGDRWPAELRPDFENVEVAISRTRGAYSGEQSIREIEKLFVDLIGRARSYIYAENQYFASRVIAKALVERLSSPDCPEIVIVNPTTGFGWLDEEAMSPARARLLKIVNEADKQGRFHIYSPVTAAGEDIYVHSKVLIVDGEVLHVGSANMNNRSMGLDSECDLTIDASLEANRGCGDRISALLYDLLGEHLGCGANAVEQHMRQGGSIVTAIEDLRGPGRHLEALQPPVFNSLEQSIAEKELLDPETSDEEFEPVARPGLLKDVTRRPRS